METPEPIVLEFVQFRFHIVIAKILLDYLILTRILSKLHRIWKKYAFVWILFYKAQGPVSRTSRERFGPEKPLLKLRPAYSVKLVFGYVVKGIKVKITAKFRASRRLRVEDTKRIMSPEIRPKSFGTFEKQAPAHTFGARSDKISSQRVPETWHLCGTITWKHYPDDK